MPFIYLYRYGKYYWRQQIKFVNSQYRRLSKKNLQPWLDDRKHMFHSIMEYAKKCNSGSIYDAAWLVHKNKSGNQTKSNSRGAFSLLLPFSEWWIPQSRRIIQLQSRWLLNYYENLYKLESNYYIDPEQKRNNFVETKKNKKEFHSKYNEFHLKRKNFKTKFAHKYG